MFSLLDYSCPVAQQRGGWQSTESILLTKASMFFVHNGPRYHRQQSSTQTEYWHRMSIATLVTCSPDAIRNPAANALSPSSLAGIIIDSLIAVVIHSFDLLDQLPRSRMNR